MNVERMREAIKVLRKVESDPNAKFKYSFWGEHNTCGTVACAGGYLAAHLPFNKEGFISPSAGNLVPMYCGFYGEDALSAFLGITHNEANIAFIEMHDFLGINIHSVKPHHVANYLEVLLTNHLAEVSA